jgi:hypothetical protein
MKSRGRNEEGDIPRTVNVFFPLCITTGIDAILDALCFSVHRSPPPTRRCVIGSTRKRECACVRLYSPKSSWGWSVVDSRIRRSLKGASTSGVAQGGSADVHYRAEYRENSSDSAAEGSPQRRARVLETVMYTLATFTSSPTQSPRRILSDSCCYRWIERTPVAFGICTYLDRPDVCPRQQMSTAAVAKSETEYSGTPSERSAGNSMRPTPLSIGDGQISASESFHHASVLLCFVWQTGRIHLRLHPPPSAQLTVGVDAMGKLRGNRLLVASVRQG